jgi:hypothetical protein
MKNPPACGLDKIPHPRQNEEYKSKNFWYNEGCTYVQVLMQSIVGIACPIPIDISLPPHPPAHVNNGIIHKCSS